MNTLSIFIFAIFFRGAIVTGSVNITGSFSRQSTSVSKKIGTPTPTSTVSTTVKFTKANHVTPKNKTTNKIRKTTPQTKFVKTKGSSTKMPLQQVIIRLNGTIRLTTRISTTRRRTSTTASVRTSTSRIPTTRKPITSTIVTTPRGTRALTTRTTKATRMTTNSVNPPTVTTLSTTRTSKSSPAAPPLGTTLNGQGATTSKRCLYQRYGYVGYGAYRTNQNS